MTQLLEQRERELVEGLRPFAEKGDCFSREDLARAIALLKDTKP